MAFVKLTRPESVRIEYDESTNDFEMIETGRSDETEVYVNTRHITMITRNPNEPYTRVTIGDGMDIAVIGLPYEIARRIHAAESAYIS